MKTHIPADGIGPSQVASQVREVYVVEHRDQKLPMRTFLSRVSAEMFAGSGRVIVYSPKEDT